MVDARAGAGRVRVAAGTAVLALLLAGTWFLWPRGRESPAPVARVEPPAAPAARKALEPEDRERLVNLLRGYLDGDAPAWFRFRIQTLQELERLEQAGFDLLADVDQLAELVYAARPFRPFLDQQVLPREDKTSKIAQDGSTGIWNVVWDSLRLSLALPAGYADLVRSKQLTTVAPYPVIVTLHDLEDFQDAKGNKEFPGREVIKRRWDEHVKANQPVLDRWILFAPVATRARFVEDGDLHPERVPLAELWQRYHVDFDKIVLEGGADALTYAASQTIFFAGLIVRGEASDIDPDLAGNLANLSVYVVGTDASPAVKTLRAAGHPADRLTVGTAEGLPDWLAKLPKRQVPKKFRWVVKDPTAQQLAYWINLDLVDPANPMPSLEVDCLDTEEHPNTLEIASRGVRELTVFLSDRLLDLDRPIRVVINGVAVPEVRIPARRPAGARVALPSTFQRTLDGFFSHPQVEVRETLYFGWYFPVSFLQIGVSTDAPAAGAAPAAAPTGTKPPASGLRSASAERAQREAVTYFGKAAEHETAGDLDKALLLYRKAIEAGPSTVKARAEAKVKELEAKGPP